MIAGDIYDKAVPSAEAVEMFDRLMEGLVQALPKANVLIIAGNHDSATRINLFRNVLKSRKIYMIGQPPRTKEEYMEKVTVQDQYGEVNFYLLPFVRPSVVREIVGMDQQGNYRGYDASLRVMIEREHIDTSKRNVLVSHQFFSLRERRQKMWQGQNQKFVWLEILMRSVRTYWRFLIMLHWDIFTSR